MKGRPGVTLASLLCRINSSHIFMNINLSITGAANVIAQATDDVFTAPTDPNNIGVGIPLTYPPVSGRPIQGVNVDGANSNTMVKVFIRDLLEDVNEDGANQTIIYERVTVASVATGNSVPFAGDLNNMDNDQWSELWQLVASTLGLLLSEIAIAPLNSNQITVSARECSLIYLDAPMTVNIEN
jgi:hypothetical protein